MPERSAISQRTYFGVEAIPGTAVPAHKRFSSLGFSPAIKTVVNPFRPRGVKFNTQAPMSREWTVARMDGVGTFTEIIYPLSSIMRRATITTPGGATLARQWEFDIDSDSEDTVETFTVEHGSFVRAGRFSHGIMSDFGLGISRSGDGMPLTGSMLGQQYTDGITLSGNAQYTLTANASPPTAGTFTLTYGAQTTTGIAHNASAASVQTALEALSTIEVGEVIVTRTTGTTTLAEANAVYTVVFTNRLGQAPQTLTGTFTGLTASNSIVLASSVTGTVPTELATILILPSHFNVFADDTAATLGTTQLLRSFNANLQLGNRQMPFYPLNRALGSFAGVTEGAIAATFSLTLGADAVGMPLANLFRTGATKFFRLEAKNGTLIDAGVANSEYRFTLDIAAKVTDPGEFSEEDGLFVIPPSFAVVHDPTWTRAIRVQVVNALTAL